MRLKVSMPTYLAGLKKAYQKQSTGYIRFAGDMVSYFQSFLLDMTLASRGFTDEHVLMNHEEDLGGKALQCEQVKRRVLTTCAGLIEFYNFDQNIENDSLGLAKE